LEYKTAIQHPESLVDGSLALLRVYLLLGEIEKAKQILSELMSPVQLSLMMPHTIWQIEAMQARFYLMQGQLNGAYYWAERYERYLEGAHRQTPAPLNAFSDLSFARILLVQEQYERLRLFLHDLRASAARDGRKYTMLESIILQALNEQASGSPEQALLFLQEALPLAATEGFVRLFLDEGPPMLQLLTRYCTAGEQRDNLPYARSLLAQFSIAPVLSLSESNETLTMREKEILRLLVAGYSNSEIATELVVSLNTVKWHILHLYQKLGVKNRVQAVAQAQLLNLLEN
jgi:LuxR family maltose regulon positive regulatory protein